MDVVVEIPEAAWQRNWVGRAIIIKTHMHRIKNVLHIFFNFYTSPQVFRILNPAHPLIKFLIPLFHWNHLFLLNYIILILHNLSTMLII